MDRLLRRDGEIIALTPKCFDLLWKLVEERGNLVQKGELMKTIWPDSFVEEGNLTQSISLLRRALGENSGEPQYIETVPRHGYRFVAEVREVQEREVEPVPKERAGSDSDASKEISRAAVPIQKEPTAERTIATAGRLAVAQPLTARKLWPWIVAAVLVTVGGHRRVAFPAQEPAASIARRPIDELSRTSNSTRRSRPTATRWLSPGMAKRRTTLTSMSS